MTIIRCDGHAFRPTSLGMDRREEPGHRVCKKCGLVVKTPAAAQYLEGKTS